MDFEWTERSQGFDAKSEGTLGRIQSSSFGKIQILWTAPWVLVLLCIISISV